MWSLEDCSVRYGYVARKILCLDMIPTYSEVVNLVRCLGDDGWRHFCSKYSLFNVETKEFVFVLADILRSLPNPKVEVCAGRGKLSFWLRRLGVDIIATDDYSWKLWGKRFCVERLSIEEALEKYNPQTVLGSWIPANEKYGVEILCFPSVRYFIDIGEGPSADSSWMNAINFDSIRKYADDLGYDVVFLPISHWAVAQTDKPTSWGITTKTKVLLFIRRKTNHTELQFKV